MRALIIDDEPLIRHHLDQMLADVWPELEIVGKAGDGLSALELVESQQPDVIFLDIRMPGLDGLGVARELDKLAKPPRIVFTTAYDQHALQAFEHQALDYLVKPISEERLAKTCERLQQLGKEAEQPDLAGLLQELKQARPEYLSWIRASRGEDIHLVQTSQVYAFVAEDKYTTVVTDQGEFIIRTPLKSLLAQLDPDQFWQIHRSTIVRLATIKVVGKDLLGRMKVTLANQQQYPVSRSAASRFKSM